MAKKEEKLDASPAIQTATKNYRSLYYIFCYIRNTQTVFFLFLAPRQSENILSEGNNDINNLIWTMHEWSRFSFSNPNNDLDLKCFNKQNNWAYETGNKRSHRRIFHQAIGKTFFLSLRK